MYRFLTEASFIIVTTQAYVSVVESEQCREGRKEKSSKKQKEEVDPVLQYPTSILHAYLATHTGVKYELHTFYQSPICIYNPILITDLFVQRSETVEVNFMIDVPLDSYISQCSVHPVRV